jgi:DNA-binding NtrC family response regulator
MHDGSGGLRPLRHVQQDVEQSLLAEALRIAAGNRSQAAKLLGISRAQFYEKLALYPRLSGKKDSS